MSKWLVMLFYTIGLAGVVYFSFRSLLFSSITADQFPNGRFLFSLVTVMFGAWVTGVGVRKYIFAFSSNKRERVKLQARFMLCTIVAVGFVW